MADFEPTDVVSGKIDRISNSGNGVLITNSSEIIVGPVKPEAVGQEVSAVVYNQDFALCLTESARTEYYDNSYKALTNQLADEPPEDCPAPGELIDVVLDHVNSSGHGNYEYKGIPVRIRHTFATDRNVTSGQPVPVKVIRIEPDQIVASAILDLEIRDSYPDRGEETTAIVAHRSHSGRGLVESFAEGIINLGPISEQAIGQEVDFVMLENGFGFCLDSSYTPSDYLEEMTTHISDEMIESSEALSEIFTDHVTEQRQRVGETSSGYRRDRTVSKQAKEAYNHSCAVCGAKRIAPNNSSEVEAAHIYPVSGTQDDEDDQGGPDTVNNTLALCRLHHWAFDNCWFVVDDDYRIVVRDRPELDGYDEFVQYNGEKLHLPEDKSQWPKIKFLKVHRTQVCDYNTW